MRLKPLNQQVAVIVGASSGIGRATALESAKHGAKVVAAARSQTGLETLVGEIEQFGGSAIAVVADVAQLDQVQRIAEQAVNHYGRIDTWVHLAATAVFAPFEQITPEEFKRVIDVNLLGQVYGAMVALPHLRRTGQGALIHVSSVEARRALPLQSAYAASKHGIEGFLESLRVELQHDGVPISVTNVMPATINTPFYNKALTKLGVQPTGIPPYYQPELVADSILYAAEHPTRDMIVGDVGRVLDFLQKVSPTAVDWLLSSTAIEGQRTQTPKAASGDNNLYQPVEGYDRAKGDFSHFAIPSFLDWLDWHPIIKWGTGLGLGTLALLAIQVMNSSSEKV
ncbi:MAG: SDR family oxidoreductase [Pegethrix bostrychoides GSE-TBD4-15B]|uniref:SDR family oxidoreductase n=1 Tax=Pegethrix bostrychoides GSE-TBD4-15B TaxID=2839662 RepID=A0A951PEV9_9CYAN|nr:SDR family oxidoreductase [Pegethrix bostrychoides GSE-TBD4-15B]